MRPIKFRGISAVENTYLGVKPGDFVYGDLFRDEVGQSYIRVFCEIQPDHMEPPEPVYFDIEVDPETVGQFIGLTDQLGAEIYEGDVDELRRVVVFRDGGFGFAYEGQQDLSDKLHPDRCKYITIIGSIHTHPELVEPNQKDTTP